MRLNGPAARRRGAAAAALGITWMTFACSQTQTEPAPPPPPPPPPAEHIPPPPDAEPKKAEELGIQILSDVGFATPESVIHDPDQDVYFVSNVNGAPLAEDGNGFISRVDPQGKVDAKFIDGQSDGVTLNAPKGLALIEGTLYVTDIDQLRSFDAATGEPKESIGFSGATFLNDVAALGGALYVSDSGLDAQFEPTGTDAIYKVIDGKAKELIAGQQLGGPNGLMPVEGGVWVVTFRSGQLYFVSDGGQKDHQQELPKGKNDGIVEGVDDRMLISSWQGNSVLEGDPDTPFVEVISGVNSPADIGYDHKRNRILIPLFSEDRVVIQKHERDKHDPDQTQEQDAETESAD